MWVSAWAILRRLKGFTGEQVDGNGLVYLRARYYAPWVGRFSLLDPSRGEANLFAYVRGNPINRTDPSPSYTKYAVCAPSDWAMRSRPCR